MWGSGWFVVWGLSFASFWRVTLTLNPTWSPRGLSKWVISRVISTLNGVTLLITLLITDLLSPSGQPSSSGWVWGSGSALLKRPSRVRRCRLQLVFFFFVFCEGSLKGVPVIEPYTTLTGNPTYRTPFLLPRRVGLGSRCHWIQSLGLIGFMRRTLTGISSPSSGLEPSRPRLAGSFIRGPAFRV